MLFIEIKPGAGGDDSKLLMNDLGSLYLKVCSTNKFEVLNFEVTNSKFEICL